MFKLLNKIDRDSKKEYQFGIKKEILYNNTIIYYPIYRDKSFWKWNNWQQIVKINNIYTIIPEFMNTPELNEEGCVEYIKGYKKYLDSLYANEIESIEFHTLEDNTINNIKEKTKFKFNIFPNILKDQ